MDTGEIKRSETGGREEWRAAGKAGSVETHRAFGIWCDVTEQWTVASFGPPAWWPNVGEASRALATIYPDGQANGQRVAEIPADGSAPVTETWYLVVARGYWGRGTTVTKATSECRKAGLGGRGKIAKATVWRYSTDVTPAAWVSSDGVLCWYGKHPEEVTL
jgi:hypothetical protein